MLGNPQANYKTIQRFLVESDPKEALLRLDNEATPFVPVNATGIPRPQPRKTE